MLTAEQAIRRQSGIGASEIAAVAGIHPYRSPLEVWLSKRTPSRGPLIESRPDGPREQVGSELEAGIRRLFCARMGKSLQAHRAVTLEHPERPFILASPDGLLLDEPAGLEIKVVGSRMEHHWEGDSLPDYVRAQCAQNLLVTGLRLWYVAALLGGTNLVFRVVERDPRLDEAIIAAATEFWERHILGDTPPPTEDLEAKRAYLRARYPSPQRKDLLRLTGEAGAHVERLALSLGEARAKADAARDEADRIELELCELLGDAPGVEGPWGKFTWLARRGTPSYKALAEELAGGVLAADLIEKHRGDPARVARLTLKETGR